MATSSLKRTLVSLMIVGASGMAASSGVYAAFNSEVSNPNATVKSKILTMSDTVNTGTACLSTAGTLNVNSNCDAVIDGTALHFPGDTVSANITIQNTGNLSTQKLSLYTGDCVDADVTSATYKGGGSPCGSVMFYLQEWSADPNTTPSGSNTAVACWYGSGTATTCDTTFTSGQTLVNFAHTHNSLGTEMALTRSFSGGKRYFTLGFQLPAAAGNTLQGRQAKVDFTWRLDQ